MYRFRARINDSAGKLTSYNTIIFDKIHNQYNTTTCTAQQSILKQFYAQVHTKQGEKIGGAATHKGNKIKVKSLLSVWYGCQQECL